MKLATEDSIQFGTTRKRRRQVGIISLIDVAFFLLIFFMVAGTIEQFEIIDVSPPAAKSGQMQAQSDLTLLLGSNGIIVFEDRLLEISDIKSLMQTRLQGSQIREVTIKADEAVPAALLVDVMDQLKLAGVEDVIIATAGAIHHE